MKFFVPLVEPDATEAAYADLARLAGRSALPPERRVAAIRFRHDSDDWVAEVGRNLTGVRVQTKRRKTGKVSVSTPLSDAAVVLAIFPGIPFIVVTDARPLTDKGSYWVNPFMAGQPTSVRYFDPPV